ncbi:MAG: hypothetical protein BWY94_01927 [Actinobacteria bacterium ADurb.BinA094]|nr:MAG: hypothetical protein BWY94_01927 [Actinobacteria bacterium ADurb.BinA094]
MTRGSRDNKPWTSRELRTFRANAHLGARACAELLGRSVASVRCAAHRHRISLRQDGSRRGSVLGQPRGVSLRRGLREELVSKRLDGPLAERLRLDREAELCPSCAARPIAVPTTGLCHICHTHALTQAHRDEIALLEAKRALWTSRQQLKRLRDRAAAAAAPDPDE